MLPGRGAGGLLGKPWQFVEEGETAGLSAGLSRAPGCRAWRWRLEPGKEIRELRGAWTQGTHTTRTLGPGLYNSKRPRKWTEWEN